MGKSGQLTTVNRLVLASWGDWADWLFATSTQPIEPVGPIGIQPIELIGPFEFSMGRVTCPDFQEPKDFHRHLLSGFGEPPGGKISYVGWQDECLQSSRFVLFC